MESLLHLTERKIDHSRNEKRQNSDRVHWSCVEYSWLKKKTVCSIAVESWLNILCATNGYNFNVS
jgi:hypothetical protein